MNRQSEELLRVTRIALRWAVEAEGERDFEAAEAYGALAANKLARAIHLNGKVIQFLRKEAAQKVEHEKKTVADGK